MCVDTTLQEGNIHTPMRKSSMLCFQVLARDIHALPSNRNVMTSTPFAPQNASHETSAKPGKYEGESKVLRKLKHEFGRSAETRADTTHSWKSSLHIIAAWVWRGGFAENYDTIDSASNPVMCWLHVFHAPFAYSRMKRFFFSSRHRFLLCNTKAFSSLEHMYISKVRSTTLLSKFRHQNITNR